MAPRPYLIEVLSVVVLVVCHQEARRRHMTWWPAQLASHTLLEGALDPHCKWHCPIMALSANGHGRRIDPSVYKASRWSSLIVRNKRDHDVA